MKKCPYCAEEIQDAAVVCRYCGRDQAAGAIQPQPPLDADAVIYQQAPVTVTRARAVLGNKTFAINNISSVSLATVPAGRGIYFILIAAGIGGLAIAATGFMAGFQSTQVFADYWALSCYLVVLPVTMAQRILLQFELQVRAVRATHSHLKVRRNLSQLLRQ